jgi:NAD(P)-dependent dehydrogenase (short-subunit alcohol dehydrogenase family)
VGVLFTKTELINVSAERFTKVLNTNVLSAFLCSKAFVKQSVAGGAIVNVSSIASRTGAPFEYVDYATSKGAMDSFTKGLSLELAAKNIRVNSVRPGFIKTDIHADGADEVAQAIAWLLSPQSSYVTGSFIDLAGGK